MNILENQEIILETKLKLDGCDKCYIIKRSEKKGTYSYRFFIPTKVAVLCSERYFSKKKAEEGLNLYFSTLTLSGFEVYINKFCHKRLETIFTAKNLKILLASILEGSNNLEDAKGKIKDVYEEHQYARIFDFLDSLVPVEQPVVDSQTKASEPTTNIEAESEEVGVLEDYYKSITHFVVVKKHFLNLEAEHWYSVVNLGDSIISTNCYSSYESALMVGDRILSETQTKKGKKILSFFRPLEEDVWNLLWSLNDGDPLITHPILDRNSWINTYKIGSENNVTARLLYSIKPAESEESVHPNSEPLTPEELEMLDDFLSCTFSCPKTDFVEIANHPKTPGLSITRATDEPTFDWNYKGISSYCSYSTAQEAYIGFVGWLIENLEITRDELSKLERRNETIHTSYH